MPGFETPQQNEPPHPSETGPFAWTHLEPEPAITGPAALQTAKLGAWDSLDPTTRARHLRALVVMSLQAATLRAEPQKLGTLSAASFADEEHNAAGAAVARTLMVIAPRGSALVAQNMMTKGGEPPIMLGAGETAGAPLVAAAIVAAVAVVGAAAYLIGRYSGETADRIDFRETKTKQLVSTQASAIEVLAKHAEREKLTGKALPFTEEEKALLRSLEDAQRGIVNERHEPLPSPFDGARSLADLGHAATGVLEALLPLALVGGALYLITRFGGESEQRGPPALPALSSAPPAHPEALTLTRNKDGVYEYEEGHG